MKFIFLISLLIPTVLFAQIDKFVFTTDVKSVELNTLSDVLTLQARDSSDGQVDTDETFDIDFISSSETGMFLNSSSNSASKVMSKGTSNKSFYYKDQSQGLFLITVSLKGRTSGKVFTASQNIGVGVDVPEGEVGENLNETLSLSSNLDSKDESSLNNIKIKTIKDKFVIVGSEVLFSAVVSSGKTNSYTRFIWNFGDGFVSEGLSTRHVYRFSGKYQVVLNIIDQQKENIFKFFVNVKEPNITIETVKGGIKITNKNKDDLALDGFSLTDRLSYFNFPPNTIISGLQSITFPKEATFISKDYIELLDNFGKVVSYSELKNDIPKDDVKVEIKKEKEILKPVVKIEKIDDSQKENILEENQNNIENNIIYKSEVKETKAYKFSKWLKGLFNLD